MILLQQALKLQMNDAKTTIEEMKQKLRKFVSERDWNEFHTPKDLSMAIATEAAEIMEHFRFRNGEVLKEYLADEENKRELSYEMADVLSFLVRMADELNVDLAAALGEKLQKNSKRYPIEAAKGKGWMAIKEAEKK